MLSTSELTQILTVLVSVGLSSVAALGESDNCQLQESTVPIARYMTITQAGRNINVLCTGNVVLNKCEGTCESSVSPSVVIHPGFRKVCRCCKETATELREILLLCNSNGNDVVDLPQPVTVRQITGCFCQSCTD